MGLLGDTQNQPPAASTSDDVDQITEIVIYVSLGISILCNFIIMMTFYFFPNLRKFPFILIFYMSLTCFLDDLIYLIGEAMTISDYNKGVCLTHGFFVSFFGLLSCTYSAGIAYAIVLKTTSLSQGKVAENREKYIHIVSIFLSSFFSVIPFFNNDYDVDGNTCWIVDDDPLVAFMMQIASYYFIVWIEMFLVLYWFIKLVVFYRSYMTTEENRAAMGDQFKTAQQLLAYPIIMIFLVLLKTIYRINLYFINYKKIDVGLTSFVYFMGNSQGTMDFFVFGMTGIIKSRLKEKIQCCFQSSNASATFVEDEHFEIQKNNTEVLKHADKDDSWENMDKSKIEEEIKNSLY